MSTVLAIGATGYCLAVLLTLSETAFLSISSRVQEKGKKSTSLEVACFFVCLFFFFRWGWGGGFNSSLKV